MSNTIFLPIIQDMEGKSDAYKFLMSKASQNIIIPGKNTQFSTLDTSKKIDNCTISYHSSELQLESSPPSVRLEDDFSEEALDQSDSVTINEIECALPQEEGDEWIVLENNCNDAKSANNSLEHVGLLYKHGMVSSNLDFTPKAISTKARKSSFDRSLDDTHCWENQRLQAPSEDVKEEVGTSQKLENSLKISKSGSSSDWNYFSLRRAWFRGMSAYYKDRFNAFVKNNGYSKQLKNEMDKIVSLFIKEEFINSKLGTWKLNTSEFLDCMITVLHSHRHKKNESYIKTRDFTKIRQVLYSFSTAAKKTFLASSDYAFILSHFYDREGQEFLNKKSENKPVKFKNDLELELNTLLKGATQTLGF